MSRRVQTGCANCRRCTNSALGEGTRRASRGASAILTLGGSELVMAGTRNCRACGHKLSLHREVAVDLPSAPSPTRSPTAEQPWNVDPQRSSDTADQLDRKASKLEDKAGRLEAEAATCDETTGLGRMNAKNKRGMARRYREEAARKRRSAARYRHELNERASVPFESIQGSLATPAAESSTATTEVGPDLTDQLSRLAQMKAAGLLSDEEFSAAKAKLLG